MKKQNWEILVMNGAAKTVLWSEKDDERVILSLFGRSRRSVVSSRIKVPKRKSDEFWKLYQEFQDKKRKVRDSEPKPVVALQEAQLTDSNASPAKHKKNAAKILGELYRKYNKLFKQLIGSGGASGLLQLDMQIDSCTAAIYAGNHLPDFADHGE